MFTKEYLKKQIQQLGIKPDEVDVSGDDILVDGEPRFFKLNKVDEDMKDYVAPDFDDTISLEEICIALKELKENIL
jgi:hypothetical protein